MKTTKKDGAQKLQRFRELYENAKCAASKIQSDFDKYMRQYKGSAEIDGSATSASATRNITYEIIESQISSEIPTPKVSAASYSEKRERNALAAESLCKMLREKLPFEEINDLDERYTYIYGGSVFYIEWDNTIISGNEVGGVKVHCISPKDFIPQPNIYRLDDMEYCFVKFLTTRGELTRRYGIKAEDCYLAQCEEENESFDGGDTVSVIISFYKTDSGTVGQFIFSGELVLSDNEDYYGRKIRYCKSCLAPEELCRCDRRKIATRELSLEILPESKESIREAAYYKPKRFPLVIRKNTSSEKSLLGQSDCEYIRPEQQAINKVESRILQKLLRSGVTPIVPEDASISVNNSVFGQVIKMKPGESMAQYGKVDTTPDISQDIAEAERLYDHAKRTLGISDAFQGIDESANESGYARQLRISQASGRLESKKKMKHTAYSYIDRIIFEHYLAFADEPRTLTYKDGFGRVHNQAFNRYDFLEFDPLRGEYYYDDDYLFSVDLNGANEGQREALWERNLENLKAGTLGDPNEPSTLLRYWQFQERAHYPNARENVEYFTELIGGDGSFGKEETANTIN